MLRGKHVLLGITGSIAAYKAAYIVRLLVREGAEVKVVMTAAAKHFITPLTLATLSRNPILTEFFNPENGQWNSHVSLGLWADLYLIAPASANTLSKMAHGIADNLARHSRQSAADDISVRQVSRDGRSGHGPGHVRASRHPGVDGHTPVPRSGDNRGCFRRAGQWSGR